MESPEDACKVAERLLQVPSLQGWSSILHLGTTEGMDSKMRAYLFH